MATGQIESEQPQNQDVLTQTIEEYKRGSLTPELVTNYWRAKLQVEGKRIGLDISVPDCDWTEEEIGKPMVDIRGKEVSSMMVYVPKQLTGKEGLILLDKMYPQTANFSAKNGTPILDGHQTTGWIKVEATIDAPNGNTRQKELEDFAKKQGYLGQRLSTYILASQASKDLTGRYLDEANTWSRLLGSRRGGHVFSARFGSGDYLTSRSRHPSLGGRFEKVKKT